jgi:RND family efflux transporter MFP subunit
MIVTLHKPSCFLCFVFALAWASPSSLPLATAQTLADPPLEMFYEGLLYPLAEVDVTASELGQMSTVNVKVGDRISAGFVIASLEDGVQKASLKLAQLQAVQNGEVESAQANERLQLEKLEALKEMADKAAVRKDELKRAESEYEIAKARLLIAVEQKNVRVEEINRHQINLDRRRIIAPTSGLIIKIYHEPGEYISPSDPAVVRLVEDHTLRAVFAVPANEINLLEIGTPCQIYLVSVAEGMKAKVSRIAPVINGESSTIEVEVDIPNPEGKFRIGDRCTMDLTAKPGARPVDRTAVRIKMNR